MHITIEKILEKDEHLEKSWPVQGETGYEFMALLDQLFTNDKNERLIENAYQYWENNPVSKFSEVVYEKKRYILYYQMAGEMDNLYRLFVDLNLINSVTYNPNLMKEAIAAFLLHCPVYRIYNGPGIFNRQQTKLLNTIFETALEKAPHLTKELNLLKSIFLTEKDRNSIEIKNADLFFNRCMQFTGPLMAKGLEDTAFYTFNRFIALNEVGDTPARFGITPEEFHREMIRKHNDFPLSLNATSTHDTKRGEDARARLCVLSDIPKLWTEYTQNWNIMNRKYKIIDAGREVPTRNDEYFIYQSIVGSMSRDISSDTDFEERIIDYITKTMREGKTESSWEDPDEYYEENTHRFVHGILSPGSAFRKNLKRLLDKIAYLGTINSLSQLLVKCTVPGVPDLYQGSECGNFSFVDPDNRRPVNFVLLEKQMDEIVQKNEKLTGLWNTPFNPKLKLLLTHLLLAERNKHPEVFEKGEYIPLNTKGRFRNMILAFARRYAETTFITVIPLHTGSFFDDDSIADMSLVEWENTRIDIPDLWPGECINLLSNNILKLEKSLYISELFKEIPLGFMKAIKKQPERKAGILMHITSLPGKYETGDFGPEAYEFADFLKRNHQSCWQMLPLNPIYENGAYSPYSSLSAFAGNIYLISPELLFRQNLISELPDSKTSRSSSKVNYAGAVITKEKVIDQAFENFNKGASKSLEKEFEAFCKKEEFWLHDYALFITLKKKFHFTKWIEWPEKFCNRDKTTLKKFHEENAGPIKREKFAQLLFLKQWNELKNYCNTKGITIFGDMPIYVNYDSADVWSHPELFKLKSNKEIKAVAGVPPDYFSREGQLWGMPVYRWDEMKKNGYGWWKQRIKKNLELFDLLRLDHFRGFSTYWEVPAGEKTAVNGKWIKGPADNFFNALKKEFPRMPFIAEDLGDVDQEVYDLRDRFALPGMRLMQFAFGTNSDTSVHAPHNHTYNSIVYTGTHDNNTTKGWFASETKHSNRRHLNRYVGKKVRYRNVHLELIRMAYASVAKLAIIPIQDFMGLGSNGRMNVPSVEKGNWEWRLTKKQLKPKIEKRIKTFVKTFGRA
jgi:4-alpha-glucanotransferase